MMAQIVLIWSAAQKSWDELEDSEIKNRIPSRNNVIKTHTASIIRKTNDFMNEEGESFFSS